MNEERLNFRTREYYNRVRKELEEEGITKKVIDNLIGPFSKYLPKDKLDKEFLKWLDKQKKFTLILICINELSVDRKKWILKNGFFGHEDFERMGYIR